MAKNVHGGGANTNINGLKFEQETDIKKVLLKIEGYRLNGNDVFHNANKVASIFSKHTLYKNF